MPPQPHYPGAGPASAKARHKKNKIMNNDKNYRYFSEADLTNVKFFALVFRSVPEATSAMQ